MREKAIKADGRKLLLNALKLINISGRNRVPNYKAYSNLDLTKIKYSNNSSNNNNSIQFMFIYVQT
jgi:hypothetical protein